ncbi:MAG: tRNA (adenine-N1)-methyltransferase [Hydrogenothermaceae bacterium]|nr:tRNA (adenine-N1)-methyltransferase [Hydrogenothermaceae bacterium]
MEKVKEGDTVYLKGKKAGFFVKVKAGEVFSTHLGNINLDSLIGKEYNSFIESHKGDSFIILKPTLYEIIMMGINRKTQIVYPKDSAYITLKLGLRSGLKVLESGIGSGAMSIVMANALYPDGRIYAYEREKDFLENAVKNIDLAGFKDVVIPHHKDLSEDIDEKDFDAAFIDVREPWYYISKVRELLKPGSMVGFLVPTTNQVSEVIKELKNCQFIDIEVEEILVRPYKPVPDRLRPEDRMVAHTGYLIFARKGF